MRVYLDNCCNNRPFDEQTQVCVRLETIAKRELIVRAEDFERMGIRPKDALQLASAEKAGCEWFLTTDRGILKKTSEIGSMRVGNPVEFITENYHGGNDNV